MLERNHGFVTDRDALAGWRIVLGLRGMSLLTPSSPPARARLALVGALLATAGAAVAPAGAQDSLPPAPGPFAVMAALDSLGERKLWPAFDPRRVPVAIYDGEHTYLFRHPDSPAEFVTSPELDSVGLFVGRHPAVRANTWIELGGVPTATIALAAGSRGSALELAALVAHEAFHAYQRPRHPDWAGNEAELFVYPMDDADALALRRLESDALRRSIATPNRGRAACWARQALQLREARFRALPEGAVAYERGTELHEGLAQYVQSRALRMRLGRGIPRAEFPPDAVRARAYAVGEALAVSLDRFDDDWKEKLEKGEARSLDELLDDILGGHALGSCGYSSRQRSAERRRARNDVAALAEQRVALRRDFLEQGGWAIVVIAEGPEPLWPEAFDPLNAAPLGDGAVLHSRWLRLGNDAGRMEVLERPALTAAAGTHPLFDGVREVVVRGFGAEPAARAADGTLVIDAPGFAARFRTAVVEREEARITVRLGRGMPPP